VIGQTVSHYKIVEELGRGGMGVVYKAEDITLKRTVALKFLAPHLLADEQQKKRFLHEAQAAAALEHPNISTVHEIHETDGQTFMVMAYIKGESLTDRIEKGPLEVNEALDVAVQVARGLSKAHSEGVVHRDIKPGNVLITPEGQAKVVDFGLAKLATQTALTKTGTSVGTVRYMSPEQARGDNTDHRTDIWSLGVVLYEMLTGQLPFRGDVEPAVVYSILNDAPRPVTSVRRDVPIALEDIIDRALEKDPAKRYQTTDEFLRALEEQRDKITLGIKQRQFTAIRKLKRRKRLTGGVAGVLIVALALLLFQMFHSPGIGVSSVAVLPFKNISGDEGQEFFSDGLTESLINEVGQIRALRVISRTSVMQFKKTHLTLPEVAAALNVDAVVEASVLRTGDRIQIGARLVRAEPEETLWSDTYSRDGRDVAIVLSEVTRAIAERIEIAVTPAEEERLRRVRTVNPEAYDAYLKGRFYADALTLEKAVEELERAIYLDPTYAPAYSALADCYNFMCLNTIMPHEEAAPKAVAAARKAIELDDQFGDAYGARANIQFFLEWDWWGPDESYKRGIELSPNSWKIRMDYSTYLVMVGRGDDAIAQVERAIELNPLAPTNDMLLVWTYYMAGRYDEAIAEGEKRFGKKPDIILAWAYAKKGRYSEAVAICDSLVPSIGEVDGEDVVSVGTMGWMYALAGQKEKAREMVALLIAAAEERPVDGFYVAMAYAGLGDRKKTLEWLERAYEQRSPSMLDMNMYFSHLAGDPRYEALIQRVGIPADRQR
jgi:TolB-like protein/tRNA A-37 threonylcarbamoyl transferase component Bud32/Tfp pilus assembly protein PilF